MVLVGLIHRNGNRRGSTDRERVHQSTGWRGLSLGGYLACLVGFVLVVPRLRVVEIEGIYS